MMLNCYVILASVVRIIYIPPILFFYYIKQAITLWQRMCDQTGLTMGPITRVYI